MMKSAVERLQRSWDVVEHGDPEECLNIHVMRLGLHGVPKKDQDIDPAFGDHCPKLLVPLEWT
ncbi:MAG: hypothetical protein MZV63_60340 [Marinilabiliales bacterium]|nr:hypothetical protein [Marinilabiliales bacterium]